MRVKRRDFIILSWFFTVEDCNKLHILMKSKSTSKWKLIHQAHGVVWSHLPFYLFSGRKLTLKLHFGWWWKRKRANACLPFRASKVTINQNICFVHWTKCKWVRLETRLSDFLIICFPFGWLMQNDDKYLAEEENAICPCQSVCWTYYRRV